MKLEEFTKSVFGDVHDKLLHYGYRGQTVDIRHVDKFTRKFDDTGFKLTQFLYIVCGQHTFRVAEVQDVDDHHLGDTYLDTLQRELDVYKLLLS